jgi:AraC family transcriptional regulator of adaptative response/methylated-DNA-[protein]-cysteine methyltransferase
VCFLEFVGKDERSALTAAWPQAQVRWNDAVAEEIASGMFQTGSQMQLKALVRGTPFQLRVWRALIRIPAGCVVSYGQLAEAVGNPGAARAVGTAVGANPLAYLIPCHRVIRETWVIGQYRWGHERKRVMLGWEGLK